MSNNYQKFALVCNFHLRKGFWFIFFFAKANMLDLRSSLALIIIFPALHIIGHEILC